MFKAWLQKMFPQTFLPLQNDDFDEDPATPPAVERRFIKAFDNSPALTYPELLANLNVFPDALHGTTPEREARRLWEQAEFGGYVVAVPGPLVPLSGDRFFAIRLDLHKFAHRSLAHRYSRRRCRGSTWSEPAWTQQTSNRQISHALCKSCAHLVPLQAHQERLQRQHLKRICLSPVVLQQASRFGSSLDAICYSFPCARPASHKRRSSKTSPSELLEAERFTIGLGQSATTHTRGKSTRRDVALELASKAAKLPRAALNMLHADRQKVFKRGFAETIVTQGLDEDVWQPGNAPTAELVRQMGTRVLNKWASSPMCVGLQTFILSRLLSESRSPTAWTVKRRQHTQSSSGCDCPPNLYHRLCNAMLRCSQGRWCKHCKCVVCLLAWLLLLMQFLTSRPRCAGYSGELSECTCSDVD